MECEFLTPTHCATEPFQRPYIKLYSPILIQSIQGSPQKLFCHILVIQILNLHKNEYKAQNYLTFKFLSNHTAEINQNSFKNWPQRYPHCLFTISTWLSSSHLEVLSFVISENVKKIPTETRYSRHLITVSQQMSIW